MAGYRRGKKNGSAAGRTGWALLLFVCGLMLADLAWGCFFGGMEVLAIPVNPASTVMLPASTDQPETTVQSAETAVIEAEKVYPDVRSGFLPVCYGRRTGKKMVALTIDDCNQAENLRKIVEVIAESGGKATIFPIGQNVSFLSDTLRKAVRQGFEIENHTQSHAGLYAETDEELAYQIWQQNREVSLALGVDYQMHFLRPRGGDNRYDQRTHAYMRQMGYCGIAFWSQDGSNSTVEEIMRNLRQGDIILFHTTDKDLRLIRELVPRLVAEGYQMVTLNEMFDLPENEQRPLEENARVMPLEEYSRFNQALQRGDYLHDVLLMQTRLDELDYLDGKYNGFFGSQTEKALKKFQKDHGLQDDGVCGGATWRALFEEE